MSGRSGTASGTGPSAHRFTRARLAWGNKEAGGEMWGEVRAGRGLGQRRIEKCGGQPGSESGKGSGHQSDDALQMMDGEEAGNTRGPSGQHAHLSYHTRGLVGVQLVAHELPHAAAKLRGQGGDEAIKHAYVDNRKSIPVHLIVHLILHLILTRTCIFVSGSRLIRLARMLRANSGSGREIKEVKPLKRGP